MENIPPLRGNDGIGEKMNEREQKWKGKKNGGNKKEEIKTKKEEKRH